MTNNANAQKFIQLASNSFKFRMLLLLKVPMAFWAGVKLKSITPQKSEATIKFKYLNQNPFRSIYFACLAMAAELSTGVLSMMHVYQSKPSVSMLVLSMNATFDKKAVGKIVFTCDEGEKIEKAVALAKETKEGQTVKVKSIGRDQQNDIVAQFEFEWTFKVKN